MRRPGARQLTVLLVGFGLAAACFTGASLYADSRLAEVALQTHVVSDNAMPSVVALGAMRRELAHAEFAVDEAADGNWTQMQGFPEHMAAYQKARREYETLPFFAGERESWERAQGALDAAERAMARVRAAVDNGSPDAANDLVVRELFPAVGVADEALAQLVHFNFDQGKRAAADADEAWGRTRRLSLLADLICTALTGLIAWIAFRSTRAFMSMQEARAEELEAFSSRVAHDVRGPLTPALFAMQVLERDPATSPPARAIVEKSIHSLKRVNQLVDDLLTFSRAAAAPECDAHASLVSVVSGVVQDAEDQAGPAGIGIEVGALPACDVACAPGVLVSVLMNLVTNAIKHMPPDAQQRLVRVTASLEGARVRVEVADTGGGLPDAVRERVFEPYFRLNATRPGLGLGLATVRRLVVAHGGSVGVCDNPGSGAVFWFQMPLHSAGVRASARLVKAPS